MNWLIGVTAPSDPVGSFLVKILHSVEGGDVEQVYSNLETILPCLRLLYLYLSLVPTRTNTRKLAEAAPLHRVLTRT